MENIQKKVGNTKYAEIFNNLMKLLDKFPDYKIYVTGHSLGGSLSTLFSFVLASNPDPRIPKPIKCITVASPRVGNITFRRAFQVRFLLNEQLDQYIMKCSINPFCLLTLGRFVVEQGAGTTTSTPTP